MLKVWDVNYESNWEGHVSGRTQTLKLTMTLPQFGSGIVVIAGVHCPSLCLEDQDTHSCISSGHLQLGLGHAGSTPPSTQSFPSCHSGDVPKNSPRYATCSQFSIPESVFWVPWTLQVTHMIHDWTRPSCPEWKAPPLSVTSESFGIGSVRVSPMALWNLVFPACCCLPSRAFQPVPPVRSWACTCPYPMSLDLLVLISLHVFSIRNKAGECSNELWVPPPTPPPDPCKQTDIWYASSQA